MNELLALRQFARQAWHDGRALALATVVGVERSSYRREGAKLLVDEDGVSCGLVSGGCLEDEVVRTAQQVMRDGLPVLQRFDTGDDGLWGLGLGCGGSVEVLVEALEDTPMWRVWGEGVGSSPLVRTLGLSPDVGLGTHAVITPTEMFGSLHCPPSYIDDAWTTRTTQRHYPWLCDVTSNATRLTVFGAGPDAIPLATMAHTLGFVVRVVDPRASYLTETAFPTATRHVVQPSTYTDLGWTSDDCVVVMHHHFERDLAALQAVFAADVRYVGQLGPASRRERLLARLAAEGEVPSESMLSRFYAPVGLNLLADGPAEIALSILSEILAVTRTASAVSLRDNADSRLVRA
ncbi:MAG: XdhC family protein [Trueperaceae bacterium]|nr:XdhC family protein [Trueperaceae bacterium]